MNKIILILGLILYTELSFGADCKWCIENNPEVTKQALEIAKVPAEKRLEKIRSLGVCVKVAQSSRKVPPIFLLGTKSKNRRCK